MSAVVYMYYSKKFQAKYIDGVVLWTSHLLQYEQYLYHVKSIQISRKNNKINLVFQQKTCKPHFMARNGEIEKFFSQNYDLSLFDIKV